MSSPSRAPLPAKWIDRIFAEMLGMYGNQWADKWRTGQTLADGHDAGVEFAKRYWAQQLAGFHDQPERLQRALEACRSSGNPHPPSLPEFLGLCRQQLPQGNAKQLPAPVIVNPELTEKVVAAVSSAPQRTPSREWAQDILERHANGDRRFADCTIRFAREALGRQ